MTCPELRTSFFLFLVVKENEYRHRHCREVGSVLRVGTGPEFLQIREAITVGIGGRIGGVQRVQAVRNFIVVRHSIAIVIRIGIIANTIAVGVDGFCRIIREGIAVITDSIGVLIAPLRWVIGKRILNIRHTVAVRIGQSAGRNCQVIQGRGSVFINRKFDEPDLGIIRGLLAA